MAQYLVYERAEVAVVAFTFDSYGFRDAREGPIHIHFLLQRCDFGPVLFEEIQEFVFDMAFYRGWSLYIFISRVVLPGF
jgi:hypothetical protein